jgi:hypothetical protein
MDALQRQCDAVLADPLYWFPIRHHSPAVARHLEAVIHERRPKLIFIEGPHEANELIPHIADAKTKPPVAIYSCYRDDANVLGYGDVAGQEGRFAVWYPMLAYSPEYVAIQTGRKIGAEVVFMDLPHYALLEPAKPKTEDPKGNATPPPGHTVQREDDRLIVDSGFYHKLAEVAGYRSWNEAWDSLFEAPDFTNSEAFRRELAVFCAAARATASSDRIKEDGTLERERFMLQTIRQVLAERKLAPEKALVVCGGFHLFLDRADSQLPPKPPAGTVYTTIVPYSFFRVSELSGYAAGNRAPQFYQTGWDLAREGRPEDALLEHVVAVLKQGRKGGEGLSSADAIAVIQHANLLSRLRGRPRPVLDDIHDALWSCCCKGDPADVGEHLLRAIDAADIGTKIGKVTPALGRLPIVNDFYAQLHDLDLGEALGKEKKVTFTLDKRENLAARRSVLFHRLRFLEIPFGAMTDAPAGDFATGTIFREKWALRWSPQVEPALIEQNLYGDTIQAASLTRLREDLAKDEMNAGKTCGRLVQSIDMDFPNLVAEVEETCGKAIDEDARFPSLSQALGSLTVLERYAVYRNLRRDRLDDLIVRCFDRACFALPDVASAPEDQQKEVVAALQGLAEVLVRDDRLNLDKALFVESVRRAGCDSTVPFLRGVFLGMLAELREMTPEALAAEISSLAKAPVDLMVTAGDFIDGIMAVSRTSILLGADALVRAIDELLRAADWDNFLVMLPRLRAAFERLHERQRESLGERVAGHYGLSEETSLTELRTSVGAAALIARIDQQVDRIMKEWEF